VSTADVGPEVNIAFPLPFVFNEFVTCSTGLALHVPGTKKKEYNKEYKDLIHGSAR